MEILNHNFILSKKPVKYQPLTGYKTIEDAYKKPSFYKVRAWTMWSNWFYHLLDNRIATNIEFKITAAGCHAFTISGYFEIDGQQYFVKITKDYNRIFRVED